PFLAEIGADRPRREGAEKVGILPLDPLPFLTRGILAAHRAELQPGSARRRRLWRRRRRHLRSLTDLGGRCDRRLLGPGGWGWGSCRWVRRRARGCGRRGHCWRWFGLRRGI